MFVSEMTVKTANVTLHIRHFYQECILTSSVLYCAVLFFYFVAVVIYGRPME